MTIRFKGHCCQDPNMPVLPDNPPNMVRAGRRMWKGPCPFMGGFDRLQMKEGRMIWCRTCDTIKYLDAGAEFVPREAYVYEVPQTSGIDQSLADTYHKALKKEHREYFHKRGISDEWIDRAKLGWRETWVTEDGKIVPWHRYSIPCYQNGILYAMQYRASKPTKRRYASETGSFSDLLYGSEDFTERSPLYVVIVEGPLDRLALESHGFPAVARFCGNNKQHPWHGQFTATIRGAIDKIIVADNDENMQGLLFANLKRVEIPGSRIVTPELKDVGEYYKSGRGAEISALLSVPPLYKET